MSDPVPAGASTRPPPLGPEQRRRLPNLVVIGAGKSGTTSLHEYLDAHPEVRMSRPKELRFFVEPDCFSRLDAYLRRFDPAAEVRGESSPAYTEYPRHPGVAERMHSLIPDARLIYVVRDPLERVVAHWAENAATLDEYRSFDEAMRDLDPARNQYVCGSLYATQLRRYLDLYPADQILVLDQRDLREERRRALREVFAFVGVREDFWSPAFEVESNVRSRPRRGTRLAERLRHSAPGRVGHALPERIRVPAGRVAQRVLTRPVGRPEPDAELRRRLLEVLAPEAAELRRLTGLPLDHWSV
jgi:hypothetical protein